MIRCQGEYFDGVTADSQHVQLVFNQQNIIIYQNDLLPKAIPLTGARVEDLGDLGQKILIQDETGYIIVRDPIASSLKDLGISGTYKKSSAEMFAKIGALAACNIAFAIAFYIFLTPISNWLANKVPFETEEAMFQGIVMEVLTKNICHDSSANNSLNYMKDTLLKSDPELASKIKVYVFDSEMINAFALPGGVILMTKAILERPVEEFTGVLAHEIAHVKQRHVLGQYIKGVIFTWGFAVLFGDYTGAMAIDPQMVQGMVGKKFSRDIEREADLVGLQLLDEARIDHQPLADFFDQLSDENSSLFNLSEKFFSTHPAMEERKTSIYSYDRKHSINHSVVDSFAWSEVDTSKLCSSTDSEILSH